MLEHEVARLRKEMAGLEARLQKPTLKGHLENLMQDYPSIAALEQRQSAGTLPMVLSEYNYFARI